MSAATGNVAPIPSSEIDLSRLGYQQLSDMARRSGSSNLSLDFLDREHILFTFNPKKLFTRHPDCPPTHSDRLVHAAVLEVPSGKVVRQADWYLHDSRRYLWSLGSGRILLRKLNTLYLVDSDLHETLLWTAAKELLWVSTTPDGKQIITEMADEGASVNRKNGGASKRQVQIEFRDVNSLAVQRVVRSEKASNVEAASSGFASVIPSFTGRVWLVRFGPAGQRRADITRVRTTRVPDVLYPSANTLLIGRDSISNPGYSVSAFTVTGNRLWRQHWKAHRYDPILARSEDGSRFAISTIALADSSTPGFDTKLQSQQEGVDQRIAVFDTASGAPVFSMLATPVVLLGQNFSLSPDGLRLAILGAAQLDIYDLPQMDSEELARYSAVKADVPGLYIPAGDVAQPQTSEPVFTTADSESVHEEKVAADSADSSNTAAASLNPSPLPVAGTSVSPSSLMTLKSRAQVVALDVVVTNAEGHTVKTLPRQDFQAKEDGKPQTITYFDEVEAHSSPQAPEHNSEVAPNFFANNSPAPDSVTLILYDLLNTPADQQQRAKLELLKFIQNKPKSSRFALCALSDTLQMIQGFTPDEGLLLKAAKGQKGLLRYTSMQTQDAQDRQTINWLTQGSVKLVARGGSKFGPAAQAMLDTAGRIEEDESQRRARDLDMRTLFTMDAFTQLARYLSAIPGRKSLIWLSGSFPLGIFPGVDLRNSDSSASSYTEQVKQAVNLLAESHIAVYPVDVRGLSASSMLTPTFSNAADSTQPFAASPSPFAPGSDKRRLDELGNLSAAGDIGANLPGGDSPFMQEMTEHGIMDRIAADTGGKAFYNTNGIQQAMTVAMEHATNYYALSYTPSNKKYDGKFRKIKVSLASSEKKLHVIHRSGYYAVDPDTAGESAKDAAKGFGLASMQHGSPQAYQILFATRVVPLSKPRKVDGAAFKPLPRPSRKKHHEQIAGSTEPVDAQRYAVDYAVTPGQLRFDATAEGVRHGIINFMITSFDEDGTLRTSVVSRAVTNLKPESYEEILKGGLRLHQEVDVPVQAASMRLGVQDALTGHLGTIEIPLPVKVPPGVEQNLAQRMPEIEPD